MRRALLFFAAWAVVLCCALALEHTDFGRFVFQHKAMMFLYLGVQIVLHLAALAACLVTMVRGPALHRAIVAFPILILVVYGLALIGGPG